MATTAGNEVAVPVAPNPKAGTLYSLMVHTVKHSTEELILNKDLFAHLIPGEYIQVVDPDKPGLRLVLKVPAPQQQSTGGTFEVSLSKTIAELPSLNLKSFTKVSIERITPEAAEVDFVELAFRRQFLQRGYMWRFKKDMFGRPVHVGQTVTAVGGVQAQVQELGLNGVPTISGVISERTHFVFRSRSARIIWLVQISSEMWDYDQNGDLYFGEKEMNTIPPTTTLLALLLTAPCQQTTPTHEYTIIPLLTHSLTHPIPSTHRIKPPCYDTLSFLTTQHTS